MEGLKLLESKQVKIIDCYVDESCIYVRTHMAHVKR